MPQAGLPPYPTLFRLRLASCIGLIRIIAALLSTPAVVARVEAESKGRSIRERHDTIRVCICISRRVGSQRVLIER